MTVVPDEDCCCKLPMHSISGHSVEHLPPFSYTPLAMHCGIDWVLWSLDPVGWFCIKCTIEIWFEMQKIAKWT